VTDVARAISDNDNSEMEPVMGLLDVGDISPDDSVPGVGAVIEVAYVEVSSSSEISGASRLKCVLPPISIGPKLSSVGADSVIGGCCSSFAAKSSNS